MNKFNHILVSNDDGFDSIGITSIAEALLAFANKVTICAPVDEQSAKSQSITIRRGLDVIKVDSDKPYNIYKVNGTPADCVRVGLALFTDVDLVVTGVNDGMNISVDTLYSGTVAAATQANLHGINSIAFSAPRRHVADFIPYYNEAIKKALEVASALDEMYILNVNFPQSVNDFKGYKLTHLGYFADKMEVEMYEDNAYHFQKYNLDYDKNDHYIDYIAYLDGYVSITPLTYDKTNYIQLEKLKKVFK